MKLLRIAACGLLAAPLVLAEPPDFKSGAHGGGSRSTTGRTDGASRDGAPREGGERGGRGERSREDLDQLRKRMQEFCEKHSPRRWAALQQSSKSDRNPWKFGGMFFRFRGLMMLENQDKPLYDIKVRQIEIDDEEYGLLKDLRAARAADNKGEIDHITDRLRDLSKEYVASRIDERTHRIASLEKALKSEKATLASETSDQKSLVEKRLESMLSDNPPHSHGHDNDDAPGHSGPRVPPQGQSDHP
jgi:hypothetical protein